MLQEWNLYYPLYQKNEEEISRFRRELNIEKKRELKLEESPLTRAICPLCLNKGKMLVHGPFYRYYLWLCEDCLSKCLKHGVVNGNCIYHINEDRNDFLTAIKNHIRIIELMQYMNVFKLLSRLNKVEKDFLLQVYNEGGSGGCPFDYIAIDKFGNKYLIDVTSVKGKWTPCVLSKREKEIAKLAKKNGFKVLVPIIRFLEN
jgi:hypothetical protein